jgi:hypothetical protein
MEVIMISLPLSYCHTLMASLLFYLFLTVPCMAATVSGGSSGIAILQLPASYSSVQLTGEGISLGSNNGNFKSKEDFKDGRYSYSIFAELPVKEKTQNNKETLNNGRGDNIKPRSTYTISIESKNFLILNGQVVNPDLKEGE